jgi:hypothetical protein
MPGELRITPAKIWISQDVAGAYSVEMLEYAPGCRKEGPQRLSTVDCLRSCPCPLFWIWPTNRETGGWNARSGRATWMLSRQLDTG